MVIASQYTGFSQRCRLGSVSSLLLSYNISQQLGIFTTASTSGWELYKFNGTVKDSHPCIQRSWSKSSIACRKTSLNRNLHFSALSCLTLRRPYSSRVIQRCFFEEVR